MILWILIRLYIGLPQGDKGYAGAPGSIGEPGSPVSDQSFSPYLIFAVFR